MPRVLLGEALADEDMPEVGAAIGALNLRAYTIWVGEAFNGAWDFFVEAGPAAVGFKLGFGAVEFGAAAFADIRAFVPEGVVFAGEGHLSALVDDDLFFFGR